MDEYLKCLYDHILETRRDETLTKTAEYRTRRTTMLLALEVMEAGLTEEQQKKVDHYLSCQDRVSVLESDCGGQYCRLYDLRHVRHRGLRQRGESH